MNGGSRSSRAMQAPKKVHSPPPSGLWPGLPGLLCELCLPLLTRPLFRLSPVPLLLLLLRPKAKLIFLSHLIVRKRPARGRCATLRSGTPNSLHDPSGTSDGVAGSARRHSATYCQGERDALAILASGPAGGHGVHAHFLAQGGYGFRGNGWS